MEVIDFFQNLENILNDFLLQAGMMAPVFSCLLILLEAIFAFLPLCVFIVINVISLGPVNGCILSWVFTVLANFFAFLLWRKGVSRYINRYIEKKAKIKKFMKQISQLSLTQLTVLIAIPFTPSFFVNLGMGVSNIEYEKYFNALLLGKTFVVLFWAFVGDSILEIKSPIEILEIIIFVIIVYSISKYINKKFHLEGK